VRQDHRGGVVFEGLFKYLARIDRCAVDGAAEEVFAGDELVAFGEVDDAEDFVIELGEPDSQVVGGDSGRGEASALADAGLARGGRRRGFPRNWPRGCRSRRFHRWCKEWS
jgi:hypothetical protein